MIRSKRLSTCLIIAILIAVNGCANPAPVPPRLTLFQPIIEQRLCDDTGNNCEVKSLCREYEESEFGEFKLKAVHPLKECQGVFGVKPDLFISLKDFIRRMKTYVEDVCQKHKGASGDVPNN